MEVALSARMGGPEVGRHYLAAIVWARSRLKTAVAGLSVEGVLSLKVEVWIGGSITDYCKNDASTSVKYFSKKELLVLSICIPKREAHAFPDGDAEQVLAMWLARGFESAALPRSAGSLDYSGIVKAVRSSMSV